MVFVLYNKTNTGCNTFRRRVPNPKTTTLDKGMSHQDNRKQNELLSTPRPCDQCTTRQIERDHLTHTLLATGHIDIDGQHHSLWEIFGDIENFEALQLHLLAVYHGKDNSQSVNDLRRFLHSAAREVAFELGVVYRGRAGGCTAVR